MRFSMKSLLVASALVAAGCAALFYPNEYLTTGFSTATLGVILLALTAAVVSRGATRAYWAGFAIFGGVYFLAAFYGDLQPNYPNVYTFRLITSDVLSSIDGWLNKLRPGRGASCDLTDLAVTMPIGHSVFTMILGLLGGAVAEWLYRRHEPS